MSKKYKYIFTYETKNLINGKLYRGVRCTNNLEDGYIGCGVRNYNHAKHLFETRGKTFPFIKAILKYGYESFERTILEYFDTPEEAYLKEEELVDKEWVSRKDTYNLAIGGRGGNLGEEVNYRKRGEGNSQSKITEVQALKVFEYLNKTDLAFKDISKELNIPIGIVYSINRGENWTHLGFYSVRPKKTILSIEDAAEIRLQYINKNDRKLTDFCKRYNLSDSSIRNILRYISFKEQDLDVKDQVLDKYYKRK